MFGYDTWLPDMRPNELMGADFIGYDVLTGDRGQAGRDDFVHDLREPFFPSGRIP